MSEPIRIVWKKMSHAEATSDFWDATDVGLYQVYGPHDIYRSGRHPDRQDVLLYIGQTKGSFSARIKSHGFAAALGDKCTICLGRLEGLTGRERDEAIDDAEMLLINCHTPPYNNTCCGDLKPGQLHRADRSIVNCGDYLDLDETVDAQDILYLG